MQYFKYKGRWVTTDQIREIRKNEIVQEEPKEPEKPKKRNFKGKLADIVIPHHNRHDHLHNCLDKLPNDIFNIIIVSGGSFAENCNKGAKLATTDNIIFLNDDTIPNPDYLIEMCEMKEDVIGGAQIIADFPTKVYKGIKVDIIDGKIEAHLTEEAPDIPNGFLMRFKRKAWDLIGGFDERFKNGGEDTHIGLKMLELGLSIGFFEKPILHKHSQSEGRLKYSKENHELLEEIWTEEKLKPLLEPEITVVIPCRKNEDADITLSSLKENIRHKTVIVKDVDEKGANWARNEGFKQVYTPFVLFSDNDILWERDALENMLKALKNSSAVYSYGSYEMEGKIYCDKEFDSKELKKHNYISTMSLIRTKHFPGFDESIERLQDWDLWLELLSRRKRGIYCGKKIFSTKKRKGITFDGKVSYEEAYEIIKQKHGL